MATIVTDGAAVVVDFDRGADVLYISLDSSAGREMMKVRTIRAALSCDMRS